MHERDVLAQTVRGGLDAPLKGGPFPDGRYGGRSPMYWSHGGGKTGYIEKIGTNTVKVFHPITDQERGFGIVGATPKERQEMFWKLGDTGVRQRLETLERQHGIYTATDWLNKSIEYDESGREHLRH